MPKGTAPENWARETSFLWQGVVGAGDRAVGSGSDPEEGLGTGGGEWSWWGAGAGTLHHSIVNHELK